MNIQNLAKPTNPNIGEYYYDTTNNSFFVYFSNKWNMVNTKETKIDIKQERKLKLDSLLVVEFIEKLKELTKTGSVEDTLDFVYDSLDFDGRFIDKYHIIDMILDKINIYELDDSVKLGFLSITSYCKDKLKNREELYNKVEIYFYSTYTKEQAIAMVQGLK